MAHRPVKTPSKRRGRGNTKAEVALAEKRAQALRLRLEGVTYRDIADRLGWKNQGSAYKAVQVEIQAIVAEPAEEVRLMELDRLNDMYAQLSTKRRAGDTDAIRTSLRIMERRAKMMGLDAPTRIDITQRIIEEAARYDLDADELLEAAEEIIKEGAIGGSSAAD